MGHMIRWRIPKSALKAKGIETAYQLAKVSGISYPTASELMAEEQPPRQKIDVSALEAVAKALDVANPFDLLHHSAK